jgi:hypothetical protein
MGRHDPDRYILDQPGRLVHDGETADRLAAPGGADRRSLFGNAMRNPLQLFSRQDEIGGFWGG